MESYFLVFALIVTLTCGVCGTPTDEDCCKANSKRFSRIEESLKILENENRNLKNVVEKQQNKISKLEGIVQEQERVEKIENQYRNRSSRLLEGGSQSLPGTEQVAFYAYLSKTEAISPHHTLIFDHVETNVGQAYNQHSGAFTVPISGVYMFSYTVFPNGAGSFASVELTVNSMPHGAIFVDSSSADGDFTGCTGFVVLALKQGDICLVRFHSTYQSAGKIESDSFMRSSFSGVKV
ncbi:complement C1q-like protein 4 [Mytilus trossulus]|uniref:complement C1q-like protein 4 n=1 Tax=Mytilus trossulus TaxID=6551 RepID=UPI003006A99C